MILPAIFPDRVEVMVYNDEAGPTLVASIELVSPRNKDPPQSRRTFAAKCAAYLHNGIGLVVIDVVTNRHANLHNALIEVLELTGETYQLQPQVLYAVSYRPVSMSSGAQIHIWHRALAVGAELPTLPLSLDKGRCVRFDIEETYVEACARTRLPFP
jgi:hypothetical protein